MIHANGPISNTHKQNKPVFDYFFQSIMNKIIHCNSMVMKWHTKYKSKRLTNYYSNRMEMKFFSNNSKGTEIIVIITAWGWKLVLITIINFIH